MSSDLTVLVNTVDGQITDVDTFTAWVGFRTRGFGATFYEVQDLFAGRLKLSSATLVVGGKRAVRTALNQIGVPPPPVPVMPASLNHCLGRRMWTTTWRDVREHFRLGSGHPVFVKPGITPKAFSGTVLNTPEDLRPFSGFDDSMPLIASNTVSFVSEWRCFVLGGEVQGLAHYAGDGFRMIDSSVVRSAIECYGNDAPAAYAADFGVNDRGATLLVEINDAYALSSYGLEPQRYAEMLEVRWRELVGCAASELHEPDSRPN